MRLLSARSGASSWKLTHGPPWGDQNDVGVAPIARAGGRGPRWLSSPFTQNDPVGVATQDPASAWLGAKLFQIETASSPVVWQ